MKLVSSAKYARANQTLQNALPFAEKIESICSRLVGVGVGDKVHPLLASRQEKRALVVVLATDRGFCGALNTNLMRFVQGSHCPKTAGWL